jgi:molybdenum cofactor cytidylyltransferase
MALAPDAHRGLGRSLAAGVAALDDAVDAAAVLLADQPGVDAALVERIVAAAARTDRPAVRPVHEHGGERVPGHPVVLSRTLFADAAALDGDAGARALWSDAPERLEEIPVSTPPAPDVDTPEDYRRLVAAPGGREA